MANPLGFVVAVGVYAALRIDYLLRGPRLVPIEQVLEAPATETDAASFMRRRLGNRPRKVRGCRWEILGEDARWVYYGWPFEPAGGFFGVETVYKVERAALDALLPAWEGFDGVAARQLARDLLRERGYRDVFEVVTRVLPGGVELYVHLPGEGWRRTWVRDPADCVLEPVDGVPDAVIRGDASSDDPRDPGT